MKCDQSTRSHSQCVNSLTNGQGPLASHADSLGTRFSSFFDALGNPTDLHRTPTTSEIDATGNTWGRPLTLCCHGDVTFSVV